MRALRRLGGKHGEKRVGILLRQRLFLRGALPADAERPNDRRFQDDAVIDGGIEDGMKYGLYLLVQRIGRTGQSVEDQLDMHRGNVAHLIAGQVRQNVRV